MRTRRHYERELGRREERHLPKMSKEVIVGRSINELPSVPRRERTLLLLILLAALTYTTIIFGRTIFRPPFWREPLWLIALDLAGLFVQVLLLFLGFRRVLESVRSRGRRR